MSEASKLWGENSGLTRIFYFFIAVPTVLGISHHIDHLVRGNHVGWPVTPEINSFTYSLVIYPLIAISLYLSYNDKVDARYWTGFFAFSAGMIAFFHISPWAVEPPQDVIGPYANPLFGYLAFGILIGLIASTVIGIVYAAKLWLKE